MIWFLIALVLGLIIAGVVVLRMLPEIRLFLAARDVSVYDKAKWHFSGDYPDDLPPENAYTHIGIFFGWIINNDLVAPEFLDDFEDDISRFRRREITAGRLMQIVDGALVDDMMNETGNAFARAYFGSWRGRYLVDYDKLLGDDLPTLYHVEDSWENFNRMATCINQRFAEWQVAGNDGGRY